jgi:hypothetical protein
MIELNKLEDWIELLKAMTIRDWLLQIRPELRTVEEHKAFKEASDLIHGVGLKLTLERTTELVKESIKKLNEKKTTNEV